MFTSFSFLCFSTVMILGVQALPLPPCLFPLSHCEPNQLTGSQTDHELIAGSQASPFCPGGQGPMKVFLRVNEWLCVPGQSPKTFREVCTGIQGAEELGSCL